MIGYVFSQFELLSAVPSQNLNLASYPATCHDLTHGLYGGPIGLFRGMNTKT